MIVTRLKGGLGNQLFQYAAGRRLALAHGAELYLDISGLAVSVRMPRHYELQPLQIKARIADERILDLVSGSRRKGLADRIIRMFQSLTPPGCIREFRERHFHFDPEVLALPDNTFLSGYWQSERYFSDVADTIRNECTVTTEPSGKNLDMLNRISACTAVSVHVRRGDYVTDPAVLAMHGICDLEYYERAVRYISERITAPEFFVFSDEVDWVRDNLKFPFPYTMVDHNNAQHCAEDLRLMSACRHHITANSTFSWWGAWLNPRTDKIVVAPQRWFNKHDVDTRDLCPAEWVRM